MWSSRLFWKFFRIYIVLHLILAGGAIILIAIIQRTQIIHQTEKRLHDTAVSIRSQLDESHTPSQKHLQSRIERLSAETGSRITLIDKKGVVLADSNEDAAKMDNHRTRPEVIQAAETGFGKQQRFSTTLGLPMLYVAIPIRPFDSAPAQLSGGFVRVAVDTRSVNLQVWSIQRFLWLFTIGIGAFAAGLTYMFFGRAMQPLTQLIQIADAVADGDYRRPIQLSDRKNEWGTLVQAFSHMQTELAHRESKLKDNSQRLETVLGSMIEGVVAVDHQGKILFANNAGCTLMNFVSRDVVGRQLVEVIRIPLMQKIVEQALQEKTTVKTEFETIGTPRRILMLRATQLPGNSGIVIVAHDVTELRQLETMRRDFVANVSHELKTPLAAIKAYAETLRMGAINDPDNNTQFVERIEQQADRLHQLIIDLIQLARVESGQAVFELADVDVGCVVETSVASFRRLANSKDIQLTTSVNLAATVQADEEGVRTILDNLISNALRYTPEGGAVDIQCDQSESFAVIQVRDTGPGIGPEHQDRIFERFYRVDKARSSDLGGTGLGLSIVKHLCQAFGGSVSLTSKPGRGSTFQVCLPLSA